MTLATTNRKPAKGSDRELGNPKIAIRFPPKMFEHIAECAIRDERSFTAQVRHYVTLGMAAAKEMLKP